MSHAIRELNWIEYQKRIRENPTVIIPTGACEVYGPHLPMGTDLIVASEIAKLVAERTGALIAPTIEIGESSALTSFSATFTIKRQTLEAFLDQLFAKLVADGFQNFLFLTGHAGNVDTVSYLIKKYIHQADIRCAQIDWWRFASANAGDILKNSGYMAHGHASECGTSVMLYLHPELVDTGALDSVDPGPNPPSFPDVIQYSRLHDRTPNALVGSALEASAEKGRTIIGFCVDRIVQYMIQSFKEVQTL